MFRLTRQVRFAVNRQADGQLGGKPTNSHGGFPSLRGFGIYLSLEATLLGELDPASNYLVNIKQIDSIIRKTAIPFISKAIADGNQQSPERVVAGVFRLLENSWQPLRLDLLRLNLSPFLSISAKAGELPMVRLSQKFEFSATHRLHNPALSADANVKTFGKCNNPHGHGHNYELQVTLVGTPSADGVLIDVPAFESIVASAIVDRFDHKNLNVELEEFRELIPTVENIARVIYRLLKPQFDDANANLATVTVWETPKTWCEYGVGDD
ncbi:MAG TPA: 6-carboxytetrahydropterin synthase [Tepidisphaeraceae bacterium]|jgi:6-pyruvoyltetrahydropterin/6-carboxytetrahydropterin synthase|nr:6-carboxytetrahydropterin synthase [Tepidisphaeraceae bacterium]